MLGGEEFSPRHPLAELGPARPEREVRFRLAGVAADRIRLVTSLHGAAEVPQDAEVARVTIEATTGPPLTFRLRAGRETAERLHDERVAHVQPAPHLSAWSLVDRRSEGAFYLARFAWPGTRRLISLRIRYTGGRGRLLLFGGTVGDRGRASFPSRPSCARATAPSGRRPAPSSTRTSAPGLGPSPSTGSSWRARRARPSAGWRRARCGRRRRWCWRTRPRRPPPAPARPRFRSRSTSPCAWSSSRR